MNEEDRREYIKMTRERIFSFQEILSELTGPETEKMQTLSNDALELLDEIAATRSESELSILRIEFHSISLQMQGLLDSPLFHKEDTGEFGMGGNWWKQN